MDGNWVLPLVVDLADFRMSDVLDSLGSVVEDSTEPLARGSIPCPRPFKHEDAQGFFHFPSSRPEPSQAQLFGDKNIILTGPSIVFEAFNRKNCVVRRLQDPDTVLKEIWMKGAAMQTIQHWLSSKRSRVALITGVLVEDCVRDKHNFVSQISTRSGRFALTFRCNLEDRQYKSTP